MCIRDRYQRRVHGQLKEYVFDVAILQDSGVYLIELNPFFTSGRGVFSEKEDGRDIINGLKRDESKDELDNVFFGVRQDADIPYADYWETVLEPEFEYKKTSKPFFEYYFKK
eukprot:TRINITY_DN1745_c0_g1_i2.p2 TRINITY_DN1745_c0_g1~~TRINITY_DN1745_c0_g1_i2.p2  ORF type:complete len:112 (-),score=30.87 TRINITY_DN1745_c0_g1_i2:84-419(-)